MGTHSRKFQEAPAIAYADDGYIKTKLSVALQILAELKRVLKQNAGLELNVAKISVLPKGVTQQAAFDAANNIIHAIPALTHHLVVKKYLLTSVSC